MLRLFVLGQSLLADRLGELRREDGQTMAEYGVVLAVIAVGVVAVFGLLSGAIQGAINSTISALTP